MLYLSVLCWNNVEVVSCLENSIHMNARTELSQQYIQNDLKLKIPEIYLNIVAD